MSLRSPVRLALAAALLASAVLAGAELALGAFTLGDVPAPHPCTATVTITGTGYLGYDAKLQQVALEGLDRAACHLNTTAAKLALALQTPAGRRRIAHGRDLEKVFRNSLQQAIAEERKAGRLNAVNAFLFGQLVQRTPLSLVTRLLGLAT